jgi:hypothetical protein
MRQERPPPVACNNILNFHDRMLDVILVNQYLDCSVIDASQSFVDVDRHHPPLQVPNS